MHTEHQNFTCSDDLRCPGKLIHEFRLGVKLSSVPDDPIMHFCQKTNKTALLKRNLVEGILFYDAF
jgi:hypothetical protein